MTRIKILIPISAIVTASLVRGYLWMPLIQFGEKLGASPSLSIVVALSRRVISCGLSVRVISSGYKGCCRLKLQPSKVTFMAYKQIVDFFKS